MDILILHKNRFQPVVGATAEEVSGNAWTLKLPKASLAKYLKGELSAESVDGAIFVVADLETEPALGSGDDRDHVYAGVYAFPA